MDSLIQITQTQINGAEVNSVNAREIHAFLKVKTKFADWIKRAIEKYDFVENEDYAILKNGNGNNALIEYFVSIDMAKELSMLENNPKGKETRKYFIQVEKQSQKILTLPEQIALIAQGHQEIDSRIKILEDTKRLENWQEASLKTAVSRKSYAIVEQFPNEGFVVGSLHRKIWSLFKKHFHLPRYNELPAIKYEEGLAFINSLTIADMV